MATPVKAERTFDVTAISAIVGIWVNFSMNHRCSACMRKSAHNGIATKGGILYNISDTLALLRLFVLILAGVVRT